MNQVLKYHDKLNFKHFQSHAVGEAGKRMAPAQKVAAMESKDLLVLRTWLKRVEENVIILTQRKKSAI